MSKYKVDDTQLAAVADAIRTKAGSSDLLEFPADFVSKVNGITAGLVTTEVTDTYTFESAINLNPGINTQFAKTFPDNVSPMTSFSFSGGSWSGKSALFPLIRYSGGKNRLIIVNVNSTVVRVPINVVLTFTYNSFSADIE